MTAIKLSHTSLNHTSDRTLASDRALVIGVVGISLFVLALFVGMAFLSGPSISSDRAAIPVPNPLTSL